MWHGVSPVPVRMWHGGASDGVNLPPPLFVRSACTVAPGCRFLFSNTRGLEGEQLKDELELQVDRCVQHIACTWHTTCNVGVALRQTTQTGWPSIRRLLRRSRTNPRIRAARQAHAHVRSHTAEAPSLLQLGCAGARYAGARRGAAASLLAHRTRLARILYHPLCSAHTAGRCGGAQRAGCPSNGAAYGQPASRMPAAGIGRGRALTESGPT